MVELHATVITGFETICCDEVREKLKVDDSQPFRGHVRFRTKIDKIQEALQLRSIDNINAVVWECEIDELGTLPAEIALQQIADVVTSIPWNLGIDVWEEAYGKEWTAKQFMKEQFSTYVSTSKSAQFPSDNPPTFRVTCKRSGEQSSHTFSSMCAARSLGAAINDCYGWKPDMKNFDIEIVLHILKNHVTVMVSLNKNSLFHRNIVAFGPTTLRGSMCYCLLRMAKISKGAVVLDALCGGGSIVVEGALACPQAHFIAGEMHVLALERCLQNKHAVDSKVRSRGSSIDFAFWDATRLPFKDNSIDAIVTDFPWGKKVRSDNRVLYPLLLTEFSRVVKPEGVVVLITHDRRSIEKAIAVSTWHTDELRLVNQGGLICNAMRLIHRKIKRTNVMK